MEWRNCLRKSNNSLSIHMFYLKEQFWWVRRCLRILCGYIRLWRNLISIRNLSNNSRKDNIQIIFHILVVCYKFINCIFKERKPQNGFITKPLLDIWNAGNWVLQTFVGRHLFNFLYDIVKKINIFLGVNCSFHFDEQSGKRVNINRHSIST